MRPDEATGLPRFPGYTNVSLLGSGGFAEVYRARRDGALDRWVAIKRFRLTLDVLIVHDADVLDGHPCLVMELCGSSLLRAAQQQGGRLPVEEVVRVGHRIATALDGAHFAGVIHGDVTPQNVLYRLSGDPVLADFGLAVLRDHGGNTAAGFNPVHAAPETLRSEAAIGPASDVYGLGSTLFAAMTGQPPFPTAMGETDMARALRVLHDPPPRPGGPTWLADLLLAMLAKEPGDRPTPGQVARQLAGGSAPGRAGCPEVVPDPSRPPSAPVFAPPPGLAPAAGDTRARADAAVHPAGTPDVVDATRVRADGRAPASAAAEPGGRAGWRRPAVLVGAGLAVAAVAGTVAVAGLGGSTSSAPPAVGAAPAAGAPPTTIELAEPQDGGTSVTLRWHADAVFDYGVEVAAEGAPGETLLAGRVDTLTVPVQPGTRYCFRVQGSAGSAGVSESNVRSLRGAVCHFDTT